MHVRPLESRVVQKLFITLTLTQENRSEPTFIGNERLFQRRCACPYLPPFWSSEPTWPTELSPACLCRVVSPSERTNHADCEDVLVGDRLSEVV